MESLRHDCTCHWWNQRNRINNVGTYIAKLVSEYTMEEVSFLTSKNFESAYNVSILAHPLLKASEAGSIVFLSSIAGLTPVRTGSIYGATKGAMNQLAKHLACEWAGDNTRVNTVATWIIRTPLSEPVFHDEKKYLRLSSLELRWDALESQRKCRQWWHFCVYLQLLI
ncbi:hypothetical protein CRYUN_Cryun02cG0185600 [Craigia yunnanensis]